MTPDGALMAPSLWSLCGIVLPDLALRSPTMTRRYVSAAELAERYGVAQRTIWRWANLGILPSPRRITKSCTRWDLTQVEEREARAAERETS